MDFQVSARKWRPQKFSELIGQEHIVRTLSNAIEMDRVSHAFLFSGTRGVGKTTTARILARVLNCEKGPTIEPCGACSLCQEISAGNCIDVQEIDGASNNGVAEVRDLIDNVRYATSSARYKIYIIDEVHMLTKNAFNALLKTLEEPPPKVVFIFATTELIKIPETILSRCQCFDFKPLSTSQINKQLDLICSQEGIKIDNKGLIEISKIGCGSMRDAQSLLDQVIAYGGQEIDTNSVEAVLGIVKGATLELFVDRLIDRKPSELIALVQEVANNGKDLNLFCRSVMEYLRNLLMIKVSQKPETLLNAHTCNLELLKKQAEGFSVDELQQMFTILSRSETEMKRSSMGQMVFEMAILRLTETRPYKKIDDLIQKINQVEDNVQKTQSSERIEQVPQAVRESSSNKETPSSNIKLSRDSSGDSFDSSIWTKVLQRVSQKRPAFEHYLNKCQVLSFDKNELQLMFADSFTLEMVGTAENIQFIVESVKSACGHEVKVVLELGEVKPTMVPPTDHEKKNSKVMEVSADKRQS